LSPKDIWVSRRKKQGGGKGNAPLNQVEGKNNTSQDQTIVGRKREKNKSMKTQRGEKKGKGGGDFILYEKGGSGKTPVVGCKTVRGPEGKHYG